MNHRVLIYVGLTILVATLLVSASSIFIDPRSFRYTWLHIVFTLASVTLVIVDFRLTKNATLVTASVAFVLILFGWYYGYINWPWKGGPAGMGLWQRNTLLCSYSCLLIGWPVTLLSHLRRRFQA